MIVVRGKVASGANASVDHMSRNIESLTEALGFTPVPGTLNVRLESPLIPTGGRLVGCDIGPPYSLYPCRVNGIDAAILWHPDNDPDRTLVEIVASIHLRTEFQLGDGDEVEIELEVSP